MKIAIDLDHTISSCKESIEFFSILTHLLIPEHYIFILTNREPNSEPDIAEELECLGIEFNKLVITDKKADFIRKHKINILFENEDEYFIDLGEDVVVFKIREEGNYSFPDKKWIGSKKTVKMIDG